MLEEVLVASAFQDHLHVDTHLLAKRSDRGSGVGLWGRDFYVIQTQQRICSNMDGPRDCHTE